MIRVGAVADIPVGEAIQVQADVPIAVFRVEDGAAGTLYAIDDTCTHQKASLADGWVEGCQVECPLHAACFDLRTGRPSGPPAKVAVRTHQVVVADGIAYVNPTVSPVTVGAATDAPVSTPVGSSVASAQVSAA